MSNNTTPTADSIKSLNFLAIGENKTLQDVITVLMDKSATTEGEHTFIVSNEEDMYAGILSQRRLLTTLFDSVDSQKSASRIKQTLLERLDQTVSAIMEGERPVLNPTTPLLEIIRLMVDPEFECLPVIEDGKVSGVVYVADVFRAAAGLALTPETSGIRVEEH